jgi:hypothetical protein
LTTAGPSCFARLTKSAKPCGLETAPAEVSASLLIFVVIPVEESCGRTLSVDPNKKETEATTISTFNSIVLYIFNSFYDSDGYVKPVFFVMLISFFGARTHL